MPCFVSKHNITTIVFLQFLSLNRIAKPQIRQKLCHLSMQFSGVQYQFQIQSVQIQATCIKLAAFCLCTLNIIAVDVLSSLNRYQQAAQRRFLTSIVHESPLFWILSWTCIRTECYHCVPVFSLNGKYQLQHASSKNMQSSFQENDDKLDLSLFEQGISTCMPFLVSKHANGTSSAIYIIAM